MIFDSLYDNYKGALSYVRIKNGIVKANDEILFMSTGKIFIKILIKFADEMRVKPIEIKRYLIKINIFSIIH